MKVAKFYQFKTSVVVSFSYKSQLYISNKRFWIETDTRRPLCIDVFSALNLLTIDA